MVVVVMNTLMEVTRMTWASPIIMASEAPLFLVAKPKAENLLPLPKIFKDCNQ